MSGTLQTVLMAAPLAFYLHLLAVWHAGRWPRVVDGRADFAALVFGLSGVVAFGPIGLVLAAVLVGEDDIFARLAVLSALVAVATLLSRRAAGRLVVYNVSPEALDGALERAVAAWPGAFRRSCDGYEHESGRAGIRVETSPRWRTATVEAVGPDPASLARALGPRLQDGLRARVGRPSPVAWALMGLSLATMLAPIVGWLLTHPSGREALRALIERP